VDDELHAAGVVEEPLDTNGPSVGKRPELGAPVDR
jgi:hypothetical protein